MLLIISVRDVEIVLALLPVASESLLISSATTAKPLPYSPACAASIAAFIARRLVSLATPLITSIISRMVPADLEMSSMDINMSLMLFSPTLAIWLRLLIKSFLFSAIRVKLLMEARVCSTEAEDSATEAA
ncbi:hypothetical protein ES703_93848 [subsurface metagenome]